MLSPWYSTSALYWLTFPSDTSRPMTLVSIPALTSATPTGTYRTLSSLSWPPNSSGMRNSFSSSPRRNAATAFFGESMSEKSGPVGFAFFLPKPNMDYLQVCMSSVRCASVTANDSVYPELPDKVGVQRILRRRADGELFAEQPVHDPGHLVPGPALARGLESAGQTNRRERGCLAERWGPQS